ncbi:MAG: DciA family protein [Phycisphaerales bacterium]|nr:DciA family protein [Phycisphaerales bacterium]
MTTVGMPDQLERLQQWRRRPMRARRIDEGISAISRRVRQLQRRIGGFVEAWEQALPESLHERTCVERIRGGVVDVIVSSSAISFELDRRLRDGLLEELRTNCRGSLVRVRLRVGPLAGGLNTD